MTEVYNPNILTTKTVTRILVIAEELLTIFPKGLKHSSILQMKTVIREHNKALNKGYCKYAIKGRGRKTRVKNFLAYTSSDIRYPEKKKLTL